MSVILANILTVANKVTYMAISAGIVAPPAVGSDPLSVGLSKALTYAIGTITAIIPTVAGVMIAKELALKQAAQDDQEMVIHDKKIRKIATAGAIGTVSSGLVTFGLAFFK